MHDRDQKHVVIVDGINRFTTLLSSWKRQQQKVDLVTRLDVIKSAIMSEKRHGSSKVAQFTDCYLCTATVLCLSTRRQVFYDSYRDSRLHGESCHLNVIVRHKLLMTYFVRTREYSSEVRMYIIHTKLHIINLVLGLSRPSTLACILQGTEIIW